MRLGLNLNEIDDAAKIILARLIVQPKEALAIAGEMQAKGCLPAFLDTLCGQTANGDPEVGLAEIDQ